MSWKPFWKNILYPTTYVAGLGKYLITQRKCEGFQHSLTSARLQKQPLSLKCIGFFFPFCQYHNMT